MNKLSTSLGYDIFLNKTFDFSLFDDEVGSLYVIDKSIYDIYGRGIPGKKVVVGPGEKAKDMSVITELYDACIEEDIDRSGCIIAVGGGATGDAAGFAASTFKRGIGFINVPTTLLSMVDSCIGGKTAIDFGGVKNQVGTFYDPKKVYICMSFLKTLPQRDICSAMGEVVKYAVLSKEFYDWLNDNLLRVHEADYNVLEDMIARCLKIKAGIVAKDRLDRGMRACLNMGHTIGHAIEIQYGVSHGLAVAAGLYNESAISYRLGILSKPHFLAIQDMTDRMDLNTDYPINKETVDLTIYDKKNDQGKIGFILPEEIGKWRRVLLSKEQLINLI